LIRVTILGREPESEEVLDRSFEDIYKLRDEFINSFEFLNWWSIKPKLIESGKFQIIYINTSPVSFYWVVDSYANDPISKNAKNSQICIDHNLFNLFKEPGTFLDLGGNIGAFSLSFGAMGWKGFVFEASSKNVNLLNKSIHLNDFDITVIDKAIYDKTGKIYFGQHGPFGLIQNEMTQGIKWEEIRCMCLNDWYKQKEVPKKFDFIKMDIEGSEVAALRGMKKM